MAQHGPWRAAERARAGGKDKENRGEEEIFRNLSRLFRDQGYQAQAEAVYQRRRGCVSVGARAGDQEHDVIAAAERDPARPFSAPRPDSHWAHGTRAQTLINDGGAFDALRQVPEAPGPWSMLPPFGLEYRERRFRLVPVQHARSRTRVPERRPAGRGAEWVDVFAPRSLSSSKLSATIRTFVEEVAWTHVLAAFEASSAEAPIAQLYFMREEDVLCVDFRQESAGQEKAVAALAERFAEGSSAAIFVQEMMTSSGPGVVLVVVNSEAFGALERSLAGGKLEDLTQVSSEPYQQRPVVRALRDFYGAPRRCLPVQRETDLARPEAGSSLRSFRTSSAWMEGPTREPAFQHGLIEAKTFANTNRVLGVA